MKKIILVFIMFSSLLLAEKVYLTNGQIVSGGLEVADGAFVLTGKDIDVTFHDGAIDAIDKDGVKYTPAQYLNTLAEPEDYEEYDEDEYELADEAEYEDTRRVYGLAGLSLSDKVKLYELEKGDKYRAASLAMIFPLMGHNYAGDSARGFAIFIGKFIVPFFMAGLVPVDTEVPDGGQYQKDVQVSVGVLTFAVMQLWEIVDAMGAVEDHNAELRGRLGIEY
jgi:hypothetical protein